MPPRDDVPHWVNEHWVNEHWKVERVVREVGGRLIVSFPFATATTDYIFELTPEEYGTHA